MKRAYTLIELLVVLAILAITGAVLFPVFARKREGNGPSCQSNLKQIGLGFLQYAQDYDERFPLIASHQVTSSTAPFATPYGWADALNPYVKSTRVFQCRSEETSREAGADAAQPGFTDYYFNTSLDRLPLKLVPSHALTFLSGDGNEGRDGTDSRYNRGALHQSWRSTEMSPARRHLGTANYLLCRWPRQSSQARARENPAVCCH